MVLTDGALRQRYFMRENDKSRAEARDSSRLCQYVRVQSKIFGMTADPLAKRQVGAERINGPHPKWGLPSVTIQQSHTPAQSGRKHILSRTSQSFVVEVNPACHIC